VATAIFYASSTGNTSDIAKDIAKILGNVETFDIASSGVEKIKEYDKIILGSSTWGEVIYKMIGKNFGMISLK